MVASVTPRFAVTESALRLIRHAEVRLGGRLPRVAQRPRIHQGPLQGTTSQQQWRQEAVFLRIISITESYVDAVSIGRLSQGVDMTSAVLSRMVEDIELSSTSNWGTRQAAFQLHHQLKLSACTRWNDLQAAIQVRNCLAHGLGNLTAKQRRNMGLATQVAILDVSIGGGRMSFGATTVSKVAAVCYAFVSDVDARLP
jgi:hypothetical protein